MKTSLLFIIIVCSMVFGMQRAVSSEPKYEVAEIREYVGAIDRNGRFVIPPKFRYLSTFKQGVASASLYNSLLESTRKRRWFGSTGLVNRRGKFVVPPIYSDFHRDDDGTILATTQDRYRLVLNRKGETIADFEPNSSAHLLGSKRILIGSMWKNYGMCSITGSTIVNQTKNFICPFLKGHAVAEVEGYYAMPQETPEERKAHPNVDIDYYPLLYSSKSELIDVNGKVLIPPRYDGLRPLSIKNFFFKEGSKWGVITSHGRRILEPLFDDVDVPLKPGDSERKLWGDSFKFNITFPNESKAVVRIGDKFSFVNYDGSRCFEKEFDDAYSFSEGMAPVGKKIGASTQLRYGFADSKGRLAISFQYEFARPFHDGLARVKTDKSWGVINKRGVSMFAPTFDWISEFNDGLAVAQQGDKWFILKKDGTQLEVPGVSMLRPFSEGLSSATSSQLSFYAVELGSKKVVERPAIEGDDERVRNVKIPLFQATHLKKEPPNTIPMPNIPPPASAKNAKDLW